MSNVNEIRGKLRLAESKASDLRRDINSGSEPPHVEQIESLERVEALVAAAIRGLDDIQRQLYTTLQGAVGG